MHLKVFIALFVGLLAVKTSVQSPTLKDDSIKKIVVEVFEDILSRTGDGLAKANEAIDYFEKNEDEIEKKVVSYAIDIGNKVNSLLLKALDTLRDGATDDGKAVLDCIDAEQSKTEDALAQVFADIGTCAAGENPKVISEVRTILGQLSDLQNDVKGQVDTLSSCSDSEMTCLTSVQSPTVEIGGMKKMVTDVLDVALTITNLILETVNEEVDKFDKNQEEFKNKVVAYAVNIGKEINDAILKGIDGFKEGATADVKAIVDCIENEKPKTEAAFTQVFGDIGTCAASENSKYIAEFKSIVGQISSLKNDVQNQNEALKKCTYTDITCLVSFASSMMKTAKKIPALVIKDFKEVIELVKVFFGDVKGCVNKVAKEVQTDAHAIFNEAVACVRK